MGKQMYIAWQCQCAEPNVCASVVYECKCECDGVYVCVCVGENWKRDNKLKEGSCEEKERL